MATLLVGMALALAWYGLPGNAGSAYPYNTFLFRPDVRFSDFSNTLISALRLNPYTHPNNPYPPTAYVLMRMFNPTVVPWNFLWFLCAGIIPLFFLLFHVLRNLFPDAIKPFGLSLLLLATCEPFLLCLDRGNIELWVILMVALSLYFFSRGHFRASAGWLVLPICLKIYPCVLLVLFLRKNKLHLIVATVAAVLVVTILSYACFSGGIVANFELNKIQLAANAEQYLIPSYGLSETASPWNLYRVCVITAHAVQTGQFHHEFWNWSTLWPRFQSALRVYMWIAALAGLLVTIYSFLIERDILRRIVVLLLFMVLASPSGAEHKITHIGTALVAFILIRQRRKGDLLVTAFLAFTLIPKKELIFRCFGPTDALVPDVSAAIILNPLSMLTALLVLVWFGVAAYDPHWSRQRFNGMLTSLGLARFSI